MASSAVPEAPACRREAECSRGGTSRRCRRRGQRIPARAPCVPGAGASLEQVPVGSRCPPGAGARPERASKASQIVPGEGGDTRQAHRSL